MKKSLKGGLHSFLSDDSDQGAATTAAHTETFLKLLLDSNRIERKESTIMEDTDGCSKQYRSVFSLYLISTICMKYGIVILLKNDIYNKLKNKNGKI